MQGGDGAVPADGQGQGLGARAKADIVTYLHIELAVIKILIN